MAPSKPTPKRVRTDAQLDRKRETDKLKHQVNRAESKTRLENIEKDVSFIRDALCGILGQLPQQSSPEEPGAAINNWIEYTIESTRGRMAAAPSTPQQDEAPLSSHLSSHLQPQGQDASPSVPSVSSRPNTVVECHCGREHNDPSECLEFTSFNVLYESHKALQERPLLALSIHKNPSLPNMLLHSIQDSSLTKLIGTALRQYQLANVETTCGLYLLVYRLLRWRIYPNPKWLQDVPEMMRPTEIQMSNLHPVSIDFLPWPDLRDYLCLHQNMDSRHSVDLYIKCMRLNWPKDKELLCRNAAGVMDLSPEFESIAFDAKNWYLTSPWSEMFPQLQKYVV